MVLPLFKTVFAYLTNGFYDACKSTLDKRVQSEKGYSHLQHQALIILTGEIAAPQFRTWITRHAKKLGVTTKIQASSKDKLAINASGAEEMIEALALACTLGPQDVFVDKMTCTPVPSDPENTA